LSGLEADVPEEGRPTDRILRAPNHLGDVVAALPAIVADGADVMVVRNLAPVLEMASPHGRVIPLDRGLRGFLRAVSVLREKRYSSGVLLTPSFSAAWLFRCGGVRRLRGTETDARGFLLKDPVSASALESHHRIDAYRHVVGMVPRGPVRAHRLVPPTPRVSLWSERLPAGGGPLVGLCPGSNAPARRWPVDRFGELARRVASAGARLVVLGGAAEVSLTGRLADAVPGSVDLGGRTDVADLAAVLSLCDVVVTNDSGPMHLAGAVGTPTVSLWGPSDPDEVRQVGSPDLRVAGPTLPCRPCYRNECPRYDQGTILTEGHEECMRLIDIEHVADAVGLALDRKVGHG